MKKIFLTSVASLFLFSGVGAATPWWEQDTVCTLNQSKCYSNMGAGYLYDTFDDTSWDDTSNCWGKKYICANALKNPGTTERVALKRNEIANAVKTTDFDTDTLSANGECFGVRKTTNGGTMAYVNGQQVRVWCRGILDNPNTDEEFENGEITLDSDPTCNELSEIGYAAIQNGKCWGKQYNMAQYRIACDANDKPTLIILNGVPWDGIESDIKTQAQADARFKEMYDNSHPRYLENFQD